MYNKIKQFSKSIREFIQSKHKTVFCSIYLFVLTLIVETFLSKVKLSKLFVASSSEKQKRKK